MSTKDKMTIDERRKYLRRMKKRYVKANRKQRTQLLDEMEKVTELHRKSLIHLTNVVASPQHNHHSQHSRQQRLELIIYVKSQRLVDKLR